MPDWNRIARDCDCIRIACLRQENVDSEHLASALASWHSAGNSGALAYIDSRTDILTQPFKARPWARSALVVSFAPQTDLAAKIRLLPQAVSNEPAALIAAYALNEDYHVTGHRKLDAVVQAIMQCSVQYAPPQGETTRCECCVDSLPVMEKQFAHLGNIGVQGKNSLIRDDENGSRIHLGVIFTSLDFPTFRPDGLISACGACTRCLHACPNRVFGNGSFDVSSCRAWLASEYRKPLSPGQQALLGNVLFGCGLCTTACPSVIHSQQPLRISAQALLAMPSAQLTALIKGTILQRTGTTLLKRNAAVALANQMTAPEWEHRKASLLACSNSPVVRQTIEWAKTSAPDNASAR